MRELLHHQFIQCSQLHKLLVLFTLLTLPYSAWGQVSYGISVAGTAVTSANAGAIIGAGITGTVTYDANTQTLTLNGANIEISTNDAIIASITAPLKVNLIGGNVISCGNHHAFNSTNGLIFQSNTGTSPGQLTITSTYDISTTNFYDIPGGANVTYENSLVATKTGTNTLIISVPVNYGITVAGTAITSTNASDVLDGTVNDGKVSYDAEHNILTLNGVNLNGAIATDIDNLIIELKGENKINADANNAIERISSNETLNLTIRPASTDPLGSINLVNSASGSPNIPLIYGVNLSLGGTLFAYPSLNNASTHDSYITSLLVGSQMVTQTGNVFSTYSNVSFDNASDKNVLTISSVTNELQSSKIISGLSNLTINYDGANTITMGDTATVITSTNSNSVLTFTKASDASSLTISNTNTRSIIHGFNSINYGDGIYLATPVPTTYINTPNNGLMSALNNTTPINSLSLIPTPTYQLWVAGTQATSTTTSGTGWSYDNDNKKLTLNGGDSGNTITGQIISGLGDLTIHITGQNTLKATGSEANLIKSTNNGVLSFETDATIGHYLYFEDSAGGSFGDNSINGFTSVAYEAGLGYFSQFSQIIETLFIEYNNDKYKLHSSNATNIVGDGIASFSYDSTNGSVLTLNNANIEVIEWETDEKLTIALNGTCSINNTGHTYAINYHGDLKIVKASGATSAELSASTNGYNPIETSGLTLGSGLYLKPISSSSTTITEDPEFVLYNGYAMTNGQTIPQAAGSLVYTESASEKTLTFTNFQDAFGDGNNQVNAIETGVAGLKVVLVGDNKITCNDPNTYAFKGTRTDASIKFVKGDDGCKLTMDGNNSSNSFSFGEGKVTYDKLVYSAVNERIICEPTPPTMSSNDQEKVVMQKDYTDGDIYYTITYADGKTTDVAKTKYTAEFAMAAPGTVEAWVEANNATTAKIKGKYFGYQDAPIILNPGETKTPVLIPAIEGGDNISYASDPYSSDDTDIATFTGGVITAVGSGNVNLTTSLTATGASVTTVILNYNNQFNTLVKVGTDISGYFQGQNQYGTYYNATDNYTIPAGMEAYVITGVNGNQVVLKSLSVLPKLTPLLLFKGTATTFYSVTTNETDDTSGNLLEHAQGETNADNKKYFVLYNDEFVKATGLITMDHNYLDLSSVNPSRGMYSIGDGSTGIRDLRIENEGLREEWYDMQGRRIDKPTQPGLYIRNGKKVVVNNK